MSQIYFDGRQLPEAKKNYVAFVDIMGTKAHMARSTKTAANFIFKLHAAVLGAWRNEKYQDVFVYPVMDGVYITAARKEDIEKIVVRIFSDLAELQIAETNPIHRFILRGCIAYGEVIHGHNVPYSASKIFETDLGYKNNILLGPAMISAYSGEGNAAPFGLYIDDSAVGGGRGKGFSADWKWYKSNALKIRDNINSQLRQAVFEYFNATLDDPKRDEHKRLVEEYLLQ